MEKENLKRSDVLIDVSLFKGNQLFKRHTFKKSQNWLAELHRLVDLYHVVDTDIKVLLSFEELPFPLQSDFFSDVRV